MPYLDLCKIKVLFFTEQISFQRLRVHTLNMSPLINFPRILMSRRCCLQAVRFNSIAVKKEDIFFNPEVQSSLQKLAGMEFDKVFRLRKLGNDPVRPIYQFMTEEELEEAREEAKRKAERKLQMTPVMEERSSKTQTLEEDPQLVGFDTCKYVFTDITFGVPARSVEKRN